MITFCPESCPKKRKRNLLLQFVHLVDQNRRWPLILKSGQIRAPLDAVRTATGGVASLVPPRLVHLVGQATKLLQKDHQPNRLGLSKSRSFAEKGNNERALCFRKARNKCKIWTKWNYSVTRRSWESRAYQAPLRPRPSGRATAERARLCVEAANSEIEQFGLLKS